MNYDISVACIEMRRACFMYETGVNADCHPISGVGTARVTIGMKLCAFPPFRPSAIAARRSVGSAARIGRARAAAARRPFCNVAPCRISSYLCRLRGRVLRRAAVVGGSAVPESCRVFNVLPRANHSHRDAAPAALLSVSAARAPSQAQNATCEQSVCGNFRTD